MKHFNILLSMIFFMFLASNAFAELKIIKQTNADTDVFSGSNQKLVLDDGRVYWVKPHITSSSDSETDYLELHDFLMIRLLVASVSITHQYFSLAGTRTA